jgi:hypothetical protein
MVIGFASVADAIREVGQFTVAPLAGANMVTPVMAGLTEVLATATADDPELSNTVAVML